MTLEPLCLASMVDFEEGTFLSRSSVARVDHLDKFIMGESRLWDLGFISPIKDFKDSGSSYFLRSSSKVLKDFVSSVGARIFYGLLSSVKFDESVEFLNRFDVSGALRSVDSSHRGTL